ncbi:hypothetical protein O0L34_g9366 [Tuta absoluta]|nr:hypothetical protein O0L34_g9366 [Tuta absoluta]
MMERSFSSSLIGVESNECGCRLINKTTVDHPGCSDDTAAVAILPDDWTPKHSGITLVNYLKEREKKHDELQQNLIAEACRVNKEIDDKVREFAEILVAHINDNQSKIDCAVQACVSDEETFTPKQRNEVLRVIHNLYQNRIEEIADFIQNALKFERERADRLKQLMRDQFQRFIAVGYKPPKDLLHDFDDRIYDVNQQLLSNNRAYSELTAELRAEADENVVKARSALNQLCLGIITDYRCQSARRSSTRGISIIKRPASANFRKSSEPTITNVIKHKQKELQKCVMQLLEAYRQAVLNAFSGLSSKLQDLNKALTNNNFDEIAKCSPNCLELQNTIENVMGHISSNFHRKISMSMLDKSQEFQKITRNDVLSIDNSLWSLGQCLWDTYTILHEAGHLWDAHMLRSALAQKLTITAVEDLLTNNDIIELANEIHINQVLEQMITSSDEEKLNDFYATLNALLKSVAEMYEKHSASEIGKLEEFLNLPPAMANTLLAEFNCFVTKHPRLPLINSVSNSPSYKAPSKEDVVQELSLTAMIKQTEHQMTSLMNWRNGFLETFENNICTVPDELVHQAQLWVTEKTTALHMRNSLKQVSYNVRKERVKAAYESRLSELRQHEARLQSHLNAIKELAVKLPEEVSNFLSLDAPELYPLKDWVSHIDEDMRKVLDDPVMIPGNKTLKMKSYVPRLARYKELFKNSLHELVQEYKPKILQQIQNARISNANFAKRLKLLSEGGKYAPHEVQKASSALLKTAELLEQCESRCLEALQSREYQFAAVADQEIILPVQKTILDFLKTKETGTHKSRDMKEKRI